MSPKKKSIPSSDLEKNTQSSKSRSTNKSLSPLTTQNQKCTAHTVKNGCQKQAGTGKREGVQTAEKLWPTPRAGNPGSRKPGTGGKILAEEVKKAEKPQKKGFRTSPTPSDAFTAKVKSSQQKPGSKHSITLAQEVLMEKGLLPTPSATERSGINPKTGKGEGLSKRVKKLWRTPDAGTHENVASPTKSLMNGTARRDQQVRLVDQVENPELMDSPQRNSSQLLLLPVDSLASLSAMPGSEGAKQMTVGSGQKCLESYQRSGPLGLLQKMLLDSLEWQSQLVNLSWKVVSLPVTRMRTYSIRYTHDKRLCYSEVFYRTLKVRVTKYNRILFQLAVSTLRTSDLESSLWHTPKGTMPDNLKSNPEVINGRIQRQTGSDFGLNLADQVKLWATPNTMDGMDCESGSLKEAISGQRQRSSNLREQVMFATPNRLDAMKPKSQKDLDREATLETERKGRSRPANLRDQIAVTEGQRFWPTPNASLGRPNEGNVRMLRAKVLRGEMTEEEAMAMLNGKSPMEAQGKIKSLWPTPSSEPRGPHTGREVTEGGQTVSKTTGTAWGMTLETAAKLWPTPTGRDHKDGTAKSCENVPANSLLGREVHLWPTPQERDYRSGEGHRWENPEERSRNLNDAVANIMGYKMTPEELPEKGEGQLHPNWVEKMMGFKEGWTEVEGYNSEAVVLIERLILGLGMAIGKATPQE